MKFVAVIQDFSVVDKILAHLRRIGGNGFSWAARGNGAACAAGGAGFGRPVVTVIIVKPPDRACGDGRRVVCEEEADARGDMIRVSTRKDLRSRKTDGIVHVTWRRRTYLPQL